ncbi:MAG: PilZ domain-containing protein, partial [Nitrospira sp.]
MSKHIAARNESVSVIGLLGQESRRQSSVPDRKKTSDAWSLSVAERRASRRLESRISTLLHFQDHTWNGQTKSLSLGGLSMEFSEDIPAMLNQQILLSVTPGATRPESVGVVCGIRVSESVLGSGQTKRGVTLAVQFARLSPGDEQVVAMWMSEGRARSKGLHLVAALIAQESEDALIDTESRQPVVAQAARARLARVPERPRQERRRQQRITVGLSTEVSLRLRAGDRILSGALTTDLTSNGACLCLSAEEDLLGSELELKWVSPTVAQRGSSVSTPSVGCSVVGEVVWTRPGEVGAPSGYRQVGGRTVLAGVRFLPVAKEAEDIIEHLLGQQQGEGLVDRAEGPSVISEFSECVRPSGHRIALCHDRPRTDLSDDAPIVVLAPGYGESKRDYVPLAYYLAGVSCRALRQCESCRRERWVGHAVSPGGYGDRSGDRAGPRGCSMAGSIHRSCGDQPG